MFLGAHVLVPEGFDEHPDERYPLLVMHGHFSHDFGGFRETPPDSDAAPLRNARFGVDGYNLIEQREAWEAHQRWVAESHPRVLIVELQHANPYYDDAYAVNSDNLGPYGDAIDFELIRRSSSAAWRGVGALRLRRLDRGLGGASDPGLLSRALQRRLLRLPIRWISAPIRW